MMRVASLIIIVPIGVVSSFIIFFGEELGWRGYLQPKLQVLFGKKLGVIILGFIWGIWHLPLCFMLYSPYTPIYCVIFHIGYCILLSIFFGFVYMKTRNLWSVIIIHLINNSMVIDASSAFGEPISLKDLILCLIFCTIVFLPFLFTKDYKGKMSIE
ncbi:CPBP family intramembrane metalloprotease [Clostridium estertheticum]|uniref:CPBP family intramembrane metalloprotease n=2 Tax=Clostridium estertheticum TaxID=238834 RepID=A0A7Y3SZK5_9CLOT|nr:CPBP family intramembrane glutamic endopeptidase [Clostridium estertheticum]MBW9173191.1 CPBP family intramembrane metalloprotease [Clostridium estertheticum]NNU78291.1 CPBP family intramembrane metalloprotease [Clostridium estertheticum]WBL45773.1 CPBP family intramembrane metalloprotease [Clostridium estertheticum]WLC73852.1 CPBP family intramembrane metalloprotease [Clostridium estertheticum]